MLSPDVKSERGLKGERELEMIIIVHPDCHLLKQQALFITECDLNVCVHLA